MTNPEKALNWIIDKLEQHAVDYQIVGGLAAIAYGSGRELADIDLYIPFSTSQALLEDIKPHIYWGPEHQKDGHWDITYLKMNYEGQKIEIGDSDHAMIFDTHQKQWVSQGIDYTRSQRRMVLGREVNVMPREQLIAYKTLLNREVDVQDIAFLTS